MVKDKNEQLFQQANGKKEWYEQGSVIWCDFDPTKGHEQKGRRPAIIVSNKSFYLLTHMIKVVAVSSSNNQQNFPTNITLPEKMQTKGYALTDQERSIDPNERNVEFIEYCPQNVLNSIIDLVLMTYEK